MKTKNWINENVGGSLLLIKQLGVVSLPKLMECSLLLHIAYGDEKLGGRTLLIRPSQVELENHAITFHLENSPIDFYFDILPVKELVGDFESYDDGSHLQIMNVLYKDGRWTAFFEKVDGNGDPFGNITENLTVQIIHP